MHCDYDSSGVSMLTLAMLPYLHKRDINVYLIGGSFGPEFEREFEKGTFTKIPYNFAKDPNLSYEEIKAAGKDIADNVKDMIHKYKLHKFIWHNPFVGIEGNQSSMTGINYLGDDPDLKGHIIAWLHDPIWQRPDLYEILARKIKEDNPKLNDIEVNSVIKNLCFNPNLTYVTINSKLQKVCEDQGLNVYLNENGVDIDRLNTVTWDHSEEILNKYNIPKDGTVLLALNRFVVRKAHEKAFLKYGLLQEFDPILIITGAYRNDLDGEYRKILQDFAEENKMKVVFGGGEFAYYNNPDTWSIVDLLNLPKKQPKLKLLGLGTSTNENGNRSGKEFPAVKEGSLIYFLDNYWDRDLGFYGYYDGIQVVPFKKQGIKEGFFDNIGLSQNPSDKEKVENLPKKLNIVNLVLTDPVYRHDMIQANKRENKEEDEKIMDMAYVLLNPKSQERKKKLEKNKEIVQDNFNIEDRTNELVDNVLLN